MTTKLYFPFVRVLLCLFSIAVIVGIVFAVISLTKKKKAIPQTNLI